MTNTKSYLKSVIQGSLYASTIVLKQKFTDVSGSVVLCSMMLEKCSNSKVIFVNEKLILSSKNIELVKPSKFDSLKCLFNSIQGKIEGSSSQWTVVFPAVDAILLCYEETNATLNNTINEFCSRLSLLRRHCSGVNFLIVVDTVFGSAGNLSANNKYIIKCVEDICTTSLTCQEMCFEPTKNVYMIKLDSFQRRSMLHREKQDAHKANSSALSESGVYHIDAYDLSFVKFVSNIAKHVIKSDSKGDVPVSSFKLTLTDSEVSARSDVILPYKANNNADLEKLNECGNSQILYDPDEFDDIDDDDPDDDLDI